MADVKKYNYLVATDMDHTLVYPAREVSEKNRAAIRALQEKGIAITIATGRSSFHIGKYTDELGITEPCITSNGGALFDPNSLSDVFSDDIDENTVREMLEIFLERHLDFVCYSSEAVYFAPYSRRKQVFIEYNEGLPDRLKAKMADFTMEMLENKSYPRFNKLLVVGADDESVDIIMKRKDVDAVFSQKDFLDIMKPGVSKGSGLLKLADLLGVPHENTFAIGDNYNDLSMLLDAGHGIAMGNSSDDIKAQCEYVTTTCLEDGFAAAVFDYILPLAEKK